MVNPKHHQLERMMTSQTKPCIVDLGIEDIQSGNINYKPNLIIEDDEDESLDFNIK